MIEVHFYVHHQDYNDVALRQCLAHLVTLLQQQETPSIVGKIT